MRIAPFGVELWMNAHETRCVHNLAETCVDSLTLGDMLTLVGRNADDLAALQATRLGYGAIEGSEALRTAIALLYARQDPENILVAHGTIGANALVYQALIEPGDRVVSLVPTYQQHVAIPESLGAETLRLPLDAAQGFLPDLDALAALCRPGTKLIALANPNNPTGALIDAPMLAAIAAIARRCGAWILCDEVYRGIDQHDPGTTASIADLYEKGISTGGMSKAFSLAGLRLGWIAAPRAVRDAAMLHRDYTTISVGVLDDHVATLALAGKDRILARSRAITRTNLALLAEWVEREPRIAWVRPRGGTTALLRYDLPMPSEALSRALLAKTGVLVTPGSAMDMEGHLRVGFANPTAALRAGLPLVSAFLAARG